MFNQDYMLASIFVKGEVSNCKYHSSGHIYFTLKDNSGVISCIMFAANRKGLGFTMEEGQQIIVYGNIDVYSRDGRYQIYAKEILLDGQGELQEQFQAMKKELEEMGMFHQSYKQPISSYIQTLGIVTARTGAAIQDMIQIATRRNPYIQIILYPAIVQGDAAVASIVAGIRALEARKVDTIIVGRGGGSIEDLWAFNEREVAQAIFDCQIPIISAVGHETDTTIADYVADMRAPTPSAAAELAVYDRRQLEEDLLGCASLLKSHFIRKIDQNKHQLERLSLQLEQRNPKNRLNEQKVYALRLEERMQERMQQILTHKKHTLSIMVERIKGLSPLEKLGQGYGYIAMEDGATLRSVEQVEVKDTIEVHVVDGILKATVIHKEVIERK